MPGPKPTPTATLINRGSWRGNTRSGEPKPAIPAKLPKPNLSGRALEVWKAVAPQLFAAGLLTHADVATFTRYCRLYAAWERAMAEVEEDSDRSAILSLGKLDEMLRRLEQNFGLSPSDRAGITVAQPTTEAEGKARFFETRG